REAYRTGIGKITVKSKYEFEEGSHGKMQIVFTEIPYQVNKARVIEKIAELAKEKRIEHISDVRDESDREGMRIVVELKKDANPQVTLNRLFKHTQLQDTQSIIMIALVDGQPRTLNIYEMLKYYIEFQEEVITRRTRFDLKKAQERAHILEGYLIALDNIDEVIRIIRSSYNDAKQKLMDRFGLSDVQAQAILDMRLARLQGLEREKIENEYKELQEKIEWFNKILSDHSVLMGVIRDELIEIRDKFGDERRTEIVPDEGEIDEEDMIEEEQVAVTLTHLGYIKRVPMDTYKTQKRGGKGITGLTTRENDFVKNLIVTSTHDYLLFFTNTGKVHRIKAYEIPEAQRTAKGTPAVNFLNLMQHERITAMIPMSRDNDGKYLICVTKKGLIKKTDTAEFATSRKTGLVAIKLKDGDELIDVMHTSGENDVLIVTQEGKSIRFNETDVRPMGRMASGVRAITLEGDDRVVSMVTCNDEEELLVVTENGFGKRTTLTEYKVQARGGKGLLTYDKSKFNKTGKLIGALVVAETDDVMLINSDGIIIRISASDVSQLGRATQGVRIMKIAEDSNIITMAKVVRDDDKEDGDSESDDGSGEQTTLNV
ncbi:MAG: DNA gyrase subunit A, partial [Clostridia bacterium]|nr:DNA gyrase subunit A [Clostridia bacterium]